MCAYMRRLRWMRDLLSSYPKQAPLDLVSSEYCGDDVVIVVVIIVVVVVVVVVAVYESVLCDVYIKK